MLAARAKTELSNKRKCHELEQLTQNQQLKASELTTSSTKLKQNLLHHNDIIPRSYVYVAPDLFRGMCSFGGNGFVTAVDGGSILRIFTEQYDKCGLSGRESGICYCESICFNNIGPRTSISPNVKNVDARRPPTAIRRTVLSTCAFIWYITRQEEGMASHRSRSFQVW
jgi:hypothetical protein